MSKARTGRAMDAHSPGKAAPKLRPHPHLYQINTWAWLDELSSQAGRQLQLTDVADAEWDKLQALGIDIVYLMGVWQRSPAGRHLFRTDAKAFKAFDHALPGWTLQSVVGSPFSIQAYQPDTRIGDWSQLDGVRSKLHARGMRLMLDFVPNHTGPDHPWVFSHPEYYVLGSEQDYQRDPAAYHLIEPASGQPYYVARGRDPYFAPWADTAQLNVYHPACRQALVATLQEISRHCDGLRCDMAMLVLNQVFASTWQHVLAGQAPPASEFWPEAMAALPDDFIWLAEVYWGMEDRLQALGFDYTYDKRLYDTLCRTILGRTILDRTSVEELKQCLRADPASQSRMARFIENHDELRSACVFAQSAFSALVPLLTTLPGLRFFHHGQFEGKTLHLPMPLNAAATEQIDSALQRMYHRALALADDAVVHQGEWQLLDVQRNGDDTYAQLIAYCWRLDAQLRLVVINLGVDAAQGRIYMSGQWPRQEDCTLIDILNQQRYTRTSSELERDGLYVRLDGYGAHVFDVLSPD